METNVRRNTLLKILYRRRHETIPNLAAELGVSERTIRRDIDVLSQTVPLYTQTGRYAGGVYLVDGYCPDRMYMTNEEMNVLCKLRRNTNAAVLSAAETTLLQKIISDYSKPSGGPQNIVSH